MFVLNDSKILKAGMPWIDSNGVQHPGNWASVWPNDVKTSYGIKEVGVQARPDDKFYIVGELNLNGSWESSPRKIDDVTTTVDGVDYVNPGLKSKWIIKTKETANTLLAPTDWQVIAKAERNRAIDSNVSTYRAAVITKCDEIETAIKACSDLDAFKKLFDSPVDSDGKPTGNPPIFDWPKK